MTRLGVLIITLLLGSAALESAAMLYGYALGEPSRLQTLGYNHCEGQPCFKGIVPSVTTWNETLKSLKPSGNVEVISNVLTLPVGGDEMDILGSWDTSKPIGVIDLIPRSKAGLSITLGQLVSVYGSPCAMGVIKLTNRYMGISLFYPSVRAVVYLINADLGPNTALQQLALVHEAEACSTSYTRWQGFVTQRYLAQRTVESTH